MENVIRNDYVLVLDVQQTTNIVALNEVASGDIENFVKSKR